MVTVIFFQYYAKRNRSTGNLYLVPQSDLTEGLYWVLKPADVSLLTIINKAVRNIPDETMNEIMNKNIPLCSRKRLLLTAFLDSNPREAVLSVSIFAAVIIVI